MNHLIDLVIGRFYYDCMDIKNLQVLPFQMPQIPGYGTSNDITLIVEDPTDGNLSEFAKQTEKFLAKLSERPEVSSATSPSAIVLVCHQLTYSTRSALSAVVPTSVTSTSLVRFTASWLQPRPNTVLTHRRCTTSSCR